MESPGLSHSAVSFITRAACILRRLAARARPSRGPFQQVQVAPLSRGSLVAPAVLSATGQTDLQSDVRSVRPPSSGSGLRRPLGPGRRRAGRAGVGACVGGRPRPPVGKASGPSAAFEGGVGAGFAAERSVKTAVGAGREARAARRREGGGRPSSPWRPRERGCGPASRGLRLGAGDGREGSGDPGRFPASGVSAGPLVF